MPQITKYNRFKRATVLIKRSQCLGRYPRKGLPSYEKLRSNNSCLAKALSIQKQKGKLLFSQNVALLAEVQDLNLACNKRDNTIVQVLQNAKEMLKMLVTMTKFVTSTISSCQEFVSSNNTNLRMSCNSFSIGDNRRLSTKLPNRGIVKPMVSGHIITKPNISLSRINMHHINNPSNLSTIEELSTSVTPAENSSVNNDSPPTTVSVREARNATSRTCRLPERLNISSPRINESQASMDLTEVNSDSEETCNSEKRNDKFTRNSRKSFTNEELRENVQINNRSIGNSVSNWDDPNEDGHKRRLGKQKKRRTGKSSRRHATSRSNRLSISNIERSNTEYTEMIGSPRVELNDVSKLLHNCQTINIRRLGSVQDDSVNESLEINNSINNTPSKQDKDDNIISESQASMDLTEVISDLEETCNSEKRNDKFTRNSRKSFTNEELRENVQTNNRSNGNNVSNWDDPLEGTSWMFDNSQEQSSLSNISMETGHLKGSNKSSIHQSIVRTSTSHKMQVNKDNVEDILSSSEEENCVETEKELDSFYSKKSTVKVCKSERENIYNLQENYEEDQTTNIQGFVTRQRGNSIEALDDDDFTLMYRSRPIHNVPFDINDLRLPVLEDSVVKSVITKEPEPEITTTLHKVTQNCLIPTIPDDIEDESLLNNSTVKLPLLSNTMDCTIPVIDISLDRQQQQNVKKKSKTYEPNNSPNTNPHEKKSRKQKKKLKNVKDPTAATVVLQKLESHVKLQTPLSTETFSQDYNSLAKRSYNSTQLDNSSDSEDSTGNRNLYSENSSLKRPRRQKAPQNLKEPNLTKKLRRLE